MPFTCEFNGCDPGPLVPDPRRPPPSGGNSSAACCTTAPLTLAGLPGSIGTAGDAYDNAQAETTQTTIGPVSYTHLDVYKRQLQSSLVFINTQLLQAVLRDPAWARRLTEDCLLYTSRCV